MRALAERTLGSEATVAEIEVNDQNKCAEEQLKSNLLAPDVSAKPNFSD